MYQSMVSLSDHCSKSFSPSAARSSFRSPLIFAASALDNATADLFARIERLHFNSVEIGMPASAAIDSAFIDKLARCKDAATRHGLDLVLATDLANAGDGSRSGALADLTQVVDGIRCIAAHRRPPDWWAKIIAARRIGTPNLFWIADTLGAPANTTGSLLETGFDFFMASVKWWDGREGWGLEQYHHFRHLAHSIGFAEAPGSESLRSELARAGLTRAEQVSAIYRQRYALTGLFGASLWMPQGYETGSSRQGARGDAAALENSIDIGSTVTAINRLKRTYPQLRKESDRRQISMDSLVGWISTDSNGAPESCFICNTGGSGAEVTLDQARGIGDGDLAPLDDATPAAVPRLIDRPFWLGPFEWRVFVRPAVPRDSLRDGGKITEETAPRDIGGSIKPNRIVIESVEPEIDGGRYPAKRVVGDRLVVSADIFRDGHDMCAANLLIRAAGDAVWSSAPMRFHDNDRWVGSAALDRAGRHIYTIEAWTDLYASWRHAISSKHDAGQDIAVELIEGRRLLTMAAEAADGESRNILLRALEEFDEHTRPGRQIDCMLAADVAAAMGRWGPRRDIARYDRSLELIVDRPAARFAAWYEMFPRSQGTKPGKSARFSDCIARLDDIRSMGFDVVYLVPIHPIGHTHRKGPNNGLVARPDDPGSPYAIGNEAGGHDAIDPALGTVRDFRRFVAACKERGMEVALDFAVQCSPDHPWVKDHPEWFEFRPDGSIKYAENPPKKYQDIVNLNLTADGPADLWRALRDVILLWVGRGVRIFRVDNPHTKPFPFWSWLIRDVQTAHPDVIFLAEAFTRPKPLRLLAKTGFTQSYTYFTWRNSKWDLTEYFTEMTQGEARDYLRPNLFTNTPDILPGFLQSGGPPAFKIRVALAATLSGVYGIYNGFELCEARAVPHSEEYLNSEKYEYKVWDWDRPGNIKSYIAALNKMRLAHAAFHDWLNLAFLPSDDDHVIFFLKRGPDRHSNVFVAINLDPFAAHRTTLTLPLRQLGLAEFEDIEIRDLMTGNALQWVGARQTVELDPADPAFIFEIMPGHGWVR